MSETISNTNKSFILYYKLEKGEKVKDIYGNKLIIKDKKPVKKEKNGIDMAELFPIYKRCVRYDGDIVDTMLDCRKIYIF